MTRRLYYEDSYMRKFTAEVIACDREGEVYQVVLDQTAFFPEGGGQSADAGTIQGNTVLDVQEKEGVIYHKVDGFTPASSIVDGAIDFTERFGRMQQHSGEHIVSGIVHQVYGYDNVGFHLGSDAVTMDFNGVIRKEQLQELEYKANIAVVNNLAIDISYPSKEKRETMTYRSKMELKDQQVRIVSIAGYDVCACCAPHVQCTGEIGIIKLTDVHPHRGGVRVTMVCGFRALQDYIKKEQNAKKISALLSAKEDNIAEAVLRLKDENLALKGFITKLNNQILQYKVQDIETGSSFVCMFEETLSGDTPRELVNLIIQKGVKTGAVFAGTREHGYRYVIGSKSIDVRIAAKVLNEQFDGRGGGKPEMVQGSLVGNPEEIKRVLEEIIN